MKQNTFLLFAFLLCILSLPAQNTGHFGKKLIVKTNLVNGRDKPFNAAELEYAVSRKWSVFLSYNHFEYGRGQKGVRTKTGIVKPARGEFDLKEISTLRDGTTSGNYAGIGFRKYFNGIIPAPYGFYMHFFAGIGKCTYQDYTVSYTYKEKFLNSVSNVVRRLDEKNLSGESKVIVLEVPSFGYQRIFRRLVCLDFRFGLLMQYCNLPDQLINNMEKNYFVRANTVSYAYGKLNGGLNVQVKLGLLLF